MDDRTSRLSRNEIRDKGSSKEQKFDLSQQRNYGSVTLHLRSENKPLEHRSARESLVLSQDLAKNANETASEVTPTTVKQLLQKGSQVNVERSPVRIFDDKEFEEVGATLVEEGSWPDAPSDHIVIGLKELPAKESFPLKAVHIQFAHCYEGQEGWQEVLARAPAGGGTLYDMEFLEDENRRRIAAFGYHAGFAGAAIALMNWAWQIAHGAQTPLPGKKPYNTESDLLKEVKSDVEEGIAKNDGKAPQVLVIGALGRCGRGALDLCHAAGIPESNLLKWDMAETAKAGPFQEIKESDVRPPYPLPPKPPF